MVSVWYARTDIMPIEDKVRIRVIDKENYVLWLAIDGDIMPPSIYLIEFSGVRHRWCLGHLL